MTNEQSKKYKRLQDRLKELLDLNERIGRLSFYIDTERENGNKVDELMKIQLSCIYNYRDLLEQRIDRGIY